MARPGLYANIHAKRKRGGKMRKKGAKGAPTAANFARAKQTARKKYWQNFVQKVKPQRNENLKCIHQRMLICMLLQFVQVKLHPVVKRRKLWVVV